MTKAWAVCLVLALFAASVAGAVSCTSGGGAPLSHVRHSTDDDDDNDNDNDDDNDDNDDNNDDDNDDNDNDDDDNDDDDNDDNDNDDNDDNDADNFQLYLGVWGSSPTDVFAVGQLPPVLHYDGFSWTEIPFPVRSIMLPSVWGTSPSDVFTVGEGTLPIFHYDGSSWSEMPGSLSGSVRGWGEYYFLQGVWGTSSTDVFAVGCDLNYHAVIGHYDGTSWSAMPIDATASRLDAVWGISPANVYTVGCGPWSDGLGCTSQEEGVILHFDGSSWSEVYGFEGNTEFMTVWGASPSDIYSGGEGGIWHYNGVAWAYGVTIPGATVDVIESVWGSSPTDVFAAGLQEVEEAFTVIHFDGASWSETTGVAANQTLSGLWGTSPSDVFAVGCLADEWGSCSYGGVILHYDSFSWSGMPLPGATNGKR